MRWEILDGVSPRLRRALRRIDGIEESDSSFKDGVGYWVNGTEIGHFEGEAALDIRLTRAGIRERRAQLRADSRVRLRSGLSDWLTVEMLRPADMDFVVELMAAAAAAHRAPAGVIPEPPPQGAQLQRRRRFH